MLGKTVFAYSLRVVVGFVFILSAILKLFSADAFELYIFGFDVLGLDASAVFARMVIAFEIFLGCTLISNLFTVFFNRLTWLVLLFFSFFLLYLFFTGNDGNCHCMGEAFELSPLESLAKNVVLGILLVPSVTLKSFKLRWPVYLVCLMAVLPFVVVNIVSPPDFIVVKDKKISVGENGLRQALAVRSSLFGQDYQKGKYVVCFYSTKCKVCFLAARKFDALMRKYNIPQQNVVQFFKASHDTDFLSEDISKELAQQLNYFKDKSGVEVVKNHSFLDTNEIMTISHVYPLFVFVDEGRVRDVSNFRMLNEQRIERFFSSSAE